MGGYFWGARCLKRPFIFFEACRNTFFIKAISEGVKSVEFEVAASSGSKEGVEPARDVKLSEEFSNFFMPKPIFQKR
jgi:hypothetical protein